MNKVILLVQRISQNKHTSLAAIVVGICELGKIWLPHYGAQFDETEKFAVGYGLIMAGDANTSAKADATLEKRIENVESNTTQITKP